MKILRKAGLFLLVFLSLHTLAFALALPNINKTKIRLAIPAGGSSHGEIVIENGTNEERTLKVYLGDWYYLPSADGSKEFVPVNSLANSCSSWISFSPAELTLKPFSKQKVNYSVKVPANASGGYYAVLFFEGIFGKVETAKENIQATMNIAVRIASLFYIEVGDTVKRNAQTKNLTMARDKQPDSYLVQLDLLNTGNADITAGGTCHIMDEDGMIYARGEFKNVYAFPRDKAKLGAQLKGKMPGGKYDLVLTIDLGKALEEDNFGSGPVMIREAEIEVGAAGEVLKVKEK